MSPHSVSPGGNQTEKAREHDPVTGVILGAEPFTLGSGSHAILFLHGWTSSPRELRFLAQEVAAAGFTCYGPLLPGHGLTMEALAPTRYSDYLSHAISVFDDLTIRYDRVSVCGLSMGGLLGLQMALTREVANLVLIAPFLRPWGRTFGIPNDWLIGRVPLPGTISKSSAGPIKYAKAAEDHIAYHAMPAAAMVSVVDASRRLRNRAVGVTCPVLIHHDVNDTTSDIAGSLHLIKSLGSIDKTLRVYQRGKHVITLDFDRAQIESETVAWLTRRQSSAQL